MDRPRPAGLYWAIVGGYYVASVAVAFGVFRWMPLGASIPLGVLQILVMSALTLVVLMYEEDWWNDFRDQNRSIVFGCSINVAAGATGVCLATH